VTDLVISESNLSELIDKCNSDVLIAPPVREFLVNSTTVLKQQVRDFSPIWRGDLRGSIEKEIDDATLPLWAKFGTRLVPHHAPDVEYGTVPHWPPISAIAEWANDHGIPPFLVARAISRRGTQPHNMFGGAVEVCQGDIDGFADDACKEIESIWSSK